jgi:hypothetical protein
LTVTTSLTWLMAAFETRTNFNRGEMKWKKVYLDGPERM